jgi:hypothetical protein
MVAFPPRGNLTVVKTIDYFIQETRIECVCESINLHWRVQTSGKLRYMVGIPLMTY